MSSAQAVSVAGSIHGEARFCFHTSEIIFRPCVDFSTKPVVLANIVGMVLSTTKTGLLLGFCQSTTNTREIEISLPLAAHGGWLCPKNKLCPFFLVKTKPINLLFYYDHGKYLLLGVEPFSKVLWFIRGWVYNLVFMEGLSPR